MPAPPPPARAALPPALLNRTHQADCLSGLADLPDGCVDVAVTSPPYWGQRGDAGLGSEADPREYVANLVARLREALRVLTPRGVLWLNLGDAYNTPINWRTEDRAYSTLGADGTGLAPENSAYTKDRGRRRAFLDREVGWLRYGNLLALPQRVVLALCDGGALYRGEVIWAKRKAIPEGRCRRPHRKHETIFLLANDERHHFRTKPPVPSVWDLPAGMNRTAHMSTFPPELPARCIEASGIPAGPDEAGRGVVLDPFMGSGTTAAAAKSLGYDFVGFELDPDRVRIAERRVADQPAPLFGPDA